MPYKSVFKYHIKDIVNAAFNVSINPTLKAQLGLDDITILRLGLNDMKNILIKALLIFLTINLSGCAAMFSGTTSNINVTSTPTGADCDITGHGVHTPGNVVLPKSVNDLIVNCQKEGFEPGTSSVPSTFNATTLVNILTGYGLVIGFIVDFSTGAAWKYVDHVNVNLIEKPKKTIIPG